MPNVATLKTARVERVQASGQIPAQVGESPVWREAEQALYWVDIPARLIARVQLETGMRTDWTLPEQVACITFDSNGTVLAGCESGLFAVTLSNTGEATFRRVAAPEFPFPSMRFNDGRCDRQGRFWAGTMVQDMAMANPAGGLYRYDTAGVLSAAIVRNLITQNGLAWSPDGTTMYVSDSHPLRRLVWAFDFDTDSGEPRNQRVFADLNRFTGRPDGAAIDTDGGYWTCANDAGVLLRFTPDGALDRTLQLPVSKPSMCAFGGRDLDTLFITSIRPATNANELDGHLLAVRPGVRGMPECGYGGLL